jgi:Flp pilus assembly protein TadB
VLGLKPTLLVLSALAALAVGIDLFVTDVMPDEAVIFALIGAASGPLAVWRLNRAERLESARRGAR